jgi:hypothetical protein
MLKMGAWLAVCGRYRPPVTQGFDLPGPHIDHGLNGEGHALFQLDIAVFPIYPPWDVIRNLRLLMEMAPDPMTDKILDHAISV